MLKSKSAVTGEKREEVKRAVAATTRSRVPENFMVVATTIGVYWGYVLLILEITRCPRQESVLEKKEEGQVEREGASLQMQVPCTE